MAFSLFNMIKHVTTTIASEKALDGEVPIETPAAVESQVIENIMDSVIELPVEGNGMIANFDPQSDSGNNINIDLLSRDSLLVQKNQKTLKPVISTIKPVFETPHTSKQLDDNVNNDAGAVITTKSIIIDTTDQTSDEDALYQNLDNNIHVMIDEDVNNDVTIQSIEAAEQPKAEHQQNRPNFTPAALFILMLVSSFSILIAVELIMFRCQGNHNPDEVDVITTWDTVNGYMEILLQYFGFQSPPPRETSMMEYANEVLNDILSYLSDVIYTQPTPKAWYEEFLESALKFAGQIMA
ncbi:uncharacterized protein [Clytia hemisphaerica]|uniref:Uncharacterized protein n=1 Tax=Clytia hemisphaerica TaxID=252671 RepID=A0A7M5VAE8_9CNID